MSGIVWTELRPAGDVDASWGIAANHDMQYILAYQYPGMTNDLYLSSDGGISWNVIVPEGAGHSTCSHNAISSTGKYMIACNSTNAYWSADYGASWAAITIESPAHYQSITMVRISDDGSHIAVGCIDYSPRTDYHVLYLSADYGVTFTKSMPAGSAVAERSLFGLAMNGTGNILYVTLDDDSLSYAYARIYISSNFGSTWSYVQLTEAIARFYQIDCNNAGNVVISNLQTGFRNQLFLSSDYAATFVEKCAGMQCPDGIPGNGSGISCDSSGNVYIRSTTYGLYYSTNFGAMSYRTEPASYIIDNWSDALVSAGGNLFLAGGNLGHRLWFGALALGEIDIAWWM
jgi:hypothetical protein